jgi:hypothetical protein
MVRNRSDLPADPAVIATNPNEDCSPATLRAFISDLLSGPEPDLESIGAAHALRELRA